MNYHQATCRSGQNMMYWNSRQHTPTEGAPPPHIHTWCMMCIMKARMGAKRRCTILYAREPCLMRLCLYSSGRRRVLCVRHNNNTLKTLPHIITESLPRWVTHLSFFRINHFGKSCQIIKTILSDYTFHTCNYLLPKYVALIIFLD